MSFSFASKCGRFGITLWPF